MKRHWLLLICMLTTAALAQAALTPEYSNASRTVIAEFDTWRIDPDYDPELMLADTFIANPKDELNWDWGQADALLGATGDYLESCLGHFDVLELHNDQDLSFYVPNFEGGEFKEVWVEVTYREYACSDSRVIPYADVYATSNDPLEESIHAPTYWDRDISQDGWITDVFSFVITPNPSYELFDLNFATEDSWDGYPVYVDKVVIETICVPEPASLVILGGGFVSLFLKKRKRS